MRRLVAVAAAAGVAITSYGVSSALLAGGGASAATSSTPIIIGGDGDVSLAVGIAGGFQAGIYRFNKDGGLDGRKIKFTGFLDDGLSGQTNLTNAHQLVENQHVLAVAPFYSEVATAATGTYLAGAKVPFIGWSTNAAFATQPKWGFGITGQGGNPTVEATSLFTQYLATTGNTKTPGKVKAAIIGVNVPVGVTAVHSTAATAKAIGIKVVYSSAPMPVFGITSYAPYAQALIASGANVVYELLDGPGSVGLAAGLKSAGFKGQIVNSLTYYPNTLASQPNEASALNGVYVSDIFPANENKTPAVKQALKDLVAVGQPPYLTSGTSTGYWSAIMLEQMLQATLKRVGGDPNKVTGAALQKTVTSGYTYTGPIAGGIGTLYFPAAGNIPSGCTTLLRIAGTSYKQIAPYQCLPLVNVVTGKQINPKTGKPTS
jgi:ABC-type branched-subunit amino acid transport system substrate-binding protein